MFDGILAPKLRRWPYERRIARRYRLDWQTRVSVGDTHVAASGEGAVLRDLSSRGAFAYLDNPPPIGARVLLSIKLPTRVETWMMHSAVVVRVERGIAGSGVAVRFDTSRPEFTKRFRLHIVQGDVDPI